MKYIIYLSILCFIVINYSAKFTEIKIDTMTLRARPVRETTKHVINYYEIEILTTAYSGIESCHYSDCVMANSEEAIVGAIACNFLPFGTKVEIDGVIYVVKDRHAKWLDDRIDIFMGYGENAYYKAINYGKQIKTIKVLDF